MDQSSVSSSSRPTWCPLWWTGDQGRHALPSLLTWSFIEIAAYAIFKGFLAAIEGFLLLSECFSLFPCFSSVVTLSEQLTPCALTANIRHSLATIWWPGLSASTIRSLALLLSSCLNVASLILFSLGDEMVRIRESHFMEWMASPRSPICSAPSPSGVSPSAFFCTSFNSMVRVRERPSCGDPSPQDICIVLESFLVLSCCFLLREARENQSILGSAKRQSSSKNLARCWMVFVMGDVCLRGLWVVLGRERKPWAETFMPYINIIKQGATFLM